MASMMGSNLCSLDAHELCNPSMDTRHMDSNTMESKVMESKVRRFDGFETDGFDVFRFEGDGLEWCMMMGSKTPIMVGLKPACSLQVEPIIA